MTNQLATQSQAEVIEQVVINGDLSALTAPQRVQYYQQVCKSIGLNPLTKPFDYISLNGKLTLYARKDAADQLRKIYGVSIDEVDITENEKQYIVKVKGHDVTGRFDVEFGVVNKTDMRGDASNAMMKAVTKAKRRLTLSICGLGWLDETEVETIPTARPVTVDAETGEIVERQTEQKPAELLEAEAMLTSKGETYGSLKTADLSFRANSMSTKLADPDVSAEYKADTEKKLAATRLIINWRASHA